MSSRNFAQWPDRSNKPCLASTGECTPRQPSALAMSRASRSSSSRMTDPAGSHSGKPEPTIGSVVKISRWWLRPR